MASKYRTTCPTCEKRLRVSEAALGQLVRCPACGREFEVHSVRSGQPTRAGAVTEIVTDADPAEEPSSPGGFDPDFSVEGRTGQKIGRFDVREAIGQGGFGRVYRAYDPENDRFVALKIPTFGPNQDIRVTRFLREAASTARLRHRNIVATFESGETSDCYYIASEFIDGEQLSERIKREKMPVQDAVRCVWRLADALAYAHGQGVIHRDVKPQNVMLDKAGEPKLMDFGLAKNLDDEVGLTTEGALLGTPAYMSPEQARGDIGRIGPASDQYSLAVVLYQLLTGNKPFNGPQHMVIAQVASNSAPPIRSLDPNLSPDLDAICRKAMHRDPDQRYLSCTDFANDLHDWLQCRPVRARSLSAVRRGLHTITSHAAVILLSSLVVTLLGVVAWAMLNPDEDPIESSVVTQPVQEADSQPVVPDLSPTESEAAVPTPPIDGSPPTESSVDTANPTPVAQADQSPTAADVASDSHSEEPSQREPAVVPMSAQLVSQIGPPTDRSNFLGAQACLDCHRSEYNAWVRSKHAHAGGVDRLKSAMATRYEALYGNTNQCRQCHPAVTSDLTDRMLVESGASCEACHGASGGRDGWLSAHAVYGRVPTAMSEESAQHRRDRHSQIDKAGMIRPAHLYEIARNCLGCHVIGDEKLVAADVGHTPASELFELLPWMQGEVRHNFQRDQWHNATSPSLHTYRTGQQPAERQRLLLVVARLANLEVCLRNLAAVADEENLETDYADVWKDRINDAHKALEEIIEIVEEPEDPDQYPPVELTELHPAVTAIDDLGRRLRDLTRENAAQAATTVADSARRFLEQHDGTALGALDEEFILNGSSPQGQAVEPRPILQAGR